MDDNSPITPSVFSPEQIEEDIAALRTILTTREASMENLGAAIKEVVDFSSAIELQRGFRAVHAPLRGCIADCQKMISTFSSLTFVLKRVQDLTQENDRLKRQMRDETNFAAVTAAINNSRDIVIQSFETIVSAESRAARLQAEVDNYEKQDDYPKAIQLSSEERAELEYLRREHRRTSA